MILIIPIKYVCLHTLILLINGHLHHYFFIFHSCKFHFYFYFYFFLIFTFYLYFYISCYFYFYFSYFIIFLTSFQIDQVKEWTTHKIPKNVPQYFSNSLIPYINFYCNFLVPLSSMRHSSSSLLIMYIQVAHVLLKY